MSDPGQRSVFREYSETLLIGFIILNFVRIFVFQAFKIPTGSMIDNLLIGDHIFVNKFIYGPPGPPWLEKLTALRDVERGDIVVFRMPKQPQFDYVKRVIGMPGDLIVIRDKRVFINGAPIEEPYTLFQDARTYRLSSAYSEPFRSRDQFGPFRVPAGHYFMMGDNRDLSYDSRFWGTVPRSFIKGRPFIVYWSFAGSGSADGRAPASKVRAMTEIVTHFFSHTRWKRTFYIVDSEVHWGREAGAQ